MAGMVRLFCHALNGINIKRSFCAVDKGWLLGTYIMKFWSNHIISSVWPNVSMLRICNEQQRSPKHTCSALNPMVFKRYY